MDVFNSIKQNNVDLISVRAYKGDAMTFLAFDLHESQKQDFAGFTIEFAIIKADGTLKRRFILNKITFSDAFLAANPQIIPKRKTWSLYAPIQRYSWVHVPSVNDAFEAIDFGDYTYRVTPRYIKNGVLLAIDVTKTVEVKINLSPFDLKNTKIGFARGFVSSEAYVYHFGLENTKIRPVGVVDSIIFDIKQKSGDSTQIDKVTNLPVIVPYTFEEQHKWLGWQARARILAFLDEAINDNSIFLKVFAFDLDEPEICKRLLALAAQKRLKIILDNSPNHKRPTDYETAFDTAFKNTPNADQSAIFRGNFSSLAHSKVFIQIQNNSPIKVLTGSTNFSTNGIYVNANHLLIFDNAKVAKLYSDVFDESFGDAKMNSFKGKTFSTTDFEINEVNLPKMTITFAPHPKPDAQRLFDRISSRILKDGNTDILFAIMKDTSDSDILRAVKSQVKSGEVFTYGITDTINKDNAEYSVFLYKPNSKRSIRVAAKGISSVLPPPFNAVPKIDGFAIHHKFIVVNFKGKDPVVYCGSSNLAFGPEQANGDNLLEIRDRDIVTAFAIEAMRLVDHYHWRNNKLKQDIINLDTTGKWCSNFYLEGDLRFVQRKLFINENLN